MEQSKEIYTSKLLHCYFDSMFSNYSQPLKLFSFYNEKQEDGKNIYIFDEKSFPVFNKHPGIINPPLNLVSGVEKYFTKPYFPNIPCQWDILAYIHNTVGMSLRHITDHSDVVCYRGFLKDLVLIPLGERLSHTYVAFMYNGITFIERVETSTGPISNQDIQKEYMKKKLNKFCTIKNGDKYSDTNSTISLDENYYVSKTTIFQRGDSSIKVMFTGGADAINPHSRPEENSFMEIKICPGHITHLFKGSALYKTWAQSFIAGNELLAAGIRKDTLANEVKLINVSDLGSKLTLPIPKIMDFVGRCLESIVNACKKCPKKYIIIPRDDFSLRVADEEAIKTFNFSRPTPSFLQAFPLQTQ